MKKKLLMMGISGLSFLVSTKGFAQVPVADFTISQPTTCVNSIVQLTDISSNTPTAWSYTVENMTGTLTVQNPTLSFSTSGEFNVTLQASNASGISAPMSKTITVNDLPVLTVGMSTAVCAGSSATLSASGASTYTWSGGAANGSAFTPTATADYTVTATDANNCVNSAVQSITVNAVPMLTLTGANFVCQGSALTQTVDGADTYSWSTGVSGNTFTDMPSANTTYTVIGSYTTTGCSSSLTKVIAVDAFPTVTAVDGSVCAGSVFTITPSGAATYTYSNGSNTVIPASNASYTITGASVNGCASTVAAVANVTVNALPVITVNSGTVCAGSNFTLTPGGAVNYTYSSGSAVVSPAASQSYTITGKDANGCAAATGAVANVTVSAAPVLTVNSGAICAGNSFTITASGASSYSYTGGSNVVNPTSNQTYSVTGTGSNGCVTATAAIANVTVNALPTLTVNSGTICAGASFTLAPTGAATYTYSNGSNVVNPTSNQTYSVTGTDANGCVTAAAAVANVTVNALPVVSVNSGAVCMGSSFTLVPTGAVTYTFSSGSNVITATTSNQTISVTGTDANGCVTAAAAVSNVTVNALPVVSVNSGAVCMGSSFTLVPTGAATYTFSNGSSVVTPTANQVISVTGTDANGCVTAAPAVANVTVNALPVVTVNSGTVCAGTAFTITASGAATYAYEGGSNVVTPSADATYSVSGTDANGCTSATPVLSSVTVNALPVVSVAMPSATICSGESTILTSTGADSYSWDSGATTASISITPSATTVYTVTGTAANGCSAKTTVTENVSDCTGIAKISNNVEAGIYPNPNNGAFTVRVSQATTVKVINSVGQTVYAADLTEGENAVSLNNQPTGVYFVQLQQGGQVKTMRVVKN
jgi:hypothetical protein